MGKFPETEFRFSHADCEDDGVGRDGDLGGDVRVTQAREKCHTQHDIIGITGK